MIVLSNVPPTHNIDYNNKLKIISMYDALKNFDKMSYHS